MSLLPVHVEKAHRAALELRILNAELRQAFLDEARHLTHLGDTAQVAFHVGHEARHASLAEGFRQHLQGDGFTGSGGTGNEAVPAGHLPYKGEGAVL